MSRVTRETVLNAAAAEFARSGPEGTRVRAIVERAGVNERMIYHHFGSKEGLYRAVLDGQWAALWRAWQPTLDAAALLPPRAGMRLALSAFFDLTLDYPLVMRLGMHEALGGWTIRPAPAPEQLAPTLRALWERGRADGTFALDADFPVVYAAALGALTALLVLGDRFAPAVGDASRPGPDASRVRDQVVALLLDGMTAGAR
jgi:AcrR family transcriptional regulator